MARIRTIKPDFFRHEGLFEAERETGMPLRVAFAGLWTAADREGRFKWLPRQLQLDALPFDDVDFSRVLDALLTRGHLVKYEVDGKVYGAIPSWHQHQVINNRESASELPAPPVQMTRESRVPDASVTPLMHAQVEGKGKEGKEIYDASVTRADAHASIPKQKKPKKTALPADFAISDRVKSWAHTKGFGDLEGHLESFMTRASANGYAYADWDAAFMNAIRDDWAGIRKGRNGTVPAGHVATLLNADEQIRLPKREVRQ